MKSNSLSKKEIKANPWGAISYENLFLPRHDSSEASENLFLAKNDFSGTSESLFLCRNAFSDKNTIQTQV